MHAWVSQRPRTAEVSKTAEHFIKTALEEHPVSLFHRSWFRKLAEEIVPAVKASTLETARRKRRAADAEVKALEEQ